MSDNQSINTEIPKTAFSMGVSGGISRLGGEMLGMGKVSLGMQRGGTHMLVFGGSGQVTVAGAEVGHEWNWGDFGVDITARGQYKTRTDERNVQVSSHDVTVTFDDPNTGNKEYNIPGNEYNIGYKPFNFGGDVTLKGTYQMTKNLKVGLGIRAGYTKPTFANVVINDDIRVEYIDTEGNSQIVKEIPRGINVHIGEPENTTGFRFSPVATMEASFGKSGEHKINISGALDEATVGYSYTLQHKTQPAQQPESENRYEL